MARDAAMIFRWAHERMVDTFATQFESDGRGGYFYRPHGRGAGIPVSKSERKAFIKIYELESRPSLPKLAVGTVAVLLISILVEMGFEANGRAVGRIGLICGLAMISAVGFVLDKRSYDAPRQAVAGRPAVGPVRSIEEARAIAIARQSWGQILGLVALATAVFAIAATTYDILHGWGRLWSLGFALIAATMGYVAIRKWRNPVG